MQNLIATILYIFLGIFLAPFSDRLFKEVPKEVKSMVKFFTIAWVLAGLAMIGFYFYNTYLR